MKRHYLLLPFTIIFALFSTIATGIADAQLVSEGLIAHWRMDEVGTTYVHDSVGGSHGTRVGGVGGHPGISGDSTSFQDAAYGITASNRLGDFGAGDFTVSAWVKLAPLPADGPGYLFTHYASYSGRYSMVALQLNNGAPTFYCRDSAGNSYYTTGPSLSQGDWHNLTAVRKSDILRLYVNGNLESTEAAPGLGNCTDQSNRPISYVRFGGSYSGPNHQSEFYSPEGVFTGLMDEIMVHGRALSPEEVEQNHTAVRNGLSAWNHLIAHWAFEETGGTAVAEITGHSSGFHTGATLGTLGIKGNAFQFDGVDDAVITSNGLGNFGEGDFSIAGWIKAGHKTSGSGCIFHHYASDLVRKANVYVSFNYTLSRPEVYYRDINANLVMVSAGERVSTDEWHHIAAIRHGTSVLLYVDGVLVGNHDSTVFGDLTDQFVWPIQYLRIGGSYTGGRNWMSAVANEEMFDGSIDELKIYSRALSAAELRYDMGDPVNASPTAAAGLDRSIRAGATVTLDGNSSFDDNTDTAELAYFWTFSMKPEGSAAMLDNARTATPSFTADLAGSYVIELVVTDAQGASSLPDYIIIGSDNQAPTAVATVNYGLALVGTVVNFNGAESTDPENDVLSYSWAITAAPAGSVASLTGGAAATQSLVMDREGTYTVTLMVSDFLGQGSPALVQVVATSPVDFAEMEIIKAAGLVKDLVPGQVTNGGNQNAFSNFLQQAATLIQQGEVTGALSKLNQAIQRTDGCALRGAPDGNGAGRDWITECTAQSEIYILLASAVAAIQ